MFNLKFDNQLNYQSNYEHRIKIFQIIEEPEKTLIPLYWFINLIIQQIEAVNQEDEDTSFKNGRAIKVNHW